MNRLLSMRALALCLTCAVVPSLQARIYDTINRSNFDPLPATDVVASDADAARFLTQATFGPTRAEITRLRSLGYSLWIDQQLSAPPTLARPFMDAVNTALVAGGQTIGHNQRLDRWFYTAAYAPDQLRQRMAFALSQIFVISDQNGTLSGEPIQVTEYWDMLARDAFINYRTLLGDVTYNPSMGKYLSHFRNRKAATGREPDENYAREVMQLFSIGLIERNLNFSPLLNAGQPIATYDQNVITNYAKLFTGFNYSDATTIFNGTNTYLAMTCIATEHDVTLKTVLDGMTIAAGQTCAQDVSDGLNIITAHPNVAPFISRQLIQRFVGSNPSANYIQRVAQKFQNNGSGERGDLGAVIKAILTDSEARGAPTATSGKLREPLLRLTAMWRAFDAQVPPTSAFGEIKMGLTNPTGTYGQRPLGAATVFNFYEPDYQQPGPIENAQLYSPEMQIINESTTFAIANNLYNYSWNSYIGMTTPPTDRPLLDLTSLTSLATPTAMVDEANLRMMYGSMSSNMRTTMINMLTFMTGASTVEKARSLIYIVAISPEAAMQR
ncbi:MAG: DUF1800 family protein [Tahibacter sp.]